MEFAKNLPKIIKEKNIKLKDLLNDLNLTDSTYRGWINGATPNSQAIIKLAIYLDVTANELLGITAGERKNALQTNNLTDEEEELLKQFRLLPEKEQYKILGKIEAIAENYKN